MTFRRLTIAAAGLVLSAAMPAFANNQDRAVLLYLTGGGASSLNHFDPRQDAKFKTGYDLGGGLGVQVSRYIALRGQFAYIHATGMDADADYINFNGTPYDRYLYSATIQFGYPTRHGLTPYVLVGGGAMTWSNLGPATYPPFTMGFGQGGVGLNYDIPNTRLGVFVQGNGFLSSFDRFGPNRNTFDSTWNAGLRFRIPF